MLAFNYGFIEFWEDYNPPARTYGGQKVTFDGENKLIYINPGVEAVNIKEDLYSNWKEWVQVRDNSKFLPAIRSIGGDATTGGQFAGDIYFMTNNWRVVYDPTVTTVTGVLYSDNFDTPWLYSENLQPLNPTLVSSLVTSIQPDLSGLDLSQLNIPSATEISDEVWNKAIADLIVAGSTGERLKKLLTLNKFLGLD